MREESRDSSDSRFHSACRCASRFAVIDFFLFSHQLDIRVLGDFCSNVFIISTQQFSSLLRTPLS